MKTREPLLLGVRADLPIAVPLDRAAGETLPRQIARQLRAAILRGELTPGARMPSTRALAASLQVARGAVVEAYAELHAEGYLEAQHGSGTRVATDLPARPPAGSPPVPVVTPRWLRGPPGSVATDGPAGRDVIDFRLGQPSVRELDLAAWRAAWRATASEAPPDDYGEAQGDPELRGALAAFLTRSRGLPSHARDVLVTSGSVQALDLLARTLIQPGDRVAFEEPGYRLARQVLRERGAVIQPIPVDEDGLRVEALPEGDEAPLLLYCTPSHQYPLGSRLSVSRRLALLDWARRNDVLIIEDDYDGEFRYGAPPLPTLASLDAGRVAYLGTLSKVLTPAVRVGYVVAPPLLLARLAREKALVDAHAPWPVQRALACFIEGGHLERHVRRMRRVYAQKREVLAQALQPALHHAELGGIEAGLHVCLHLRPDVNAAEVATRCEARGVRVTTLDSYHHGPPSGNALLLGYGGLTPGAIRRGAATLVQAISEVAAVSPASGSNAPSGSGG